MTTKIFVGNLAFQTTDQALADAFTDCGNVKSGVIITRGRRSLGYGFVEFATPDEALSAVSQKNQTELLNRTIKVELVRDPSAPVPRPARQPRAAGNQGQQGGQGGQGQGGQGQGGENQNANTGEGGDDGNEGGPALRRPTNRRLRRRRPNRRGNEENGPNSNTGNQNNNNNSNSNNNQSNNNNNNTGAEGNNNEDVTAIPRRRRNNNNTRPPRNPVASDEPPREKILSKTAVFVANLPFSVTDDQLKTLFAAHNVKSARVVTTRTGRSRGYGFVDFGTEEDQQEAIKDKNNSTVDGNNGNRVINVSVSHSVAPTNETNPTTTAT